MIRTIAILLLLAATAAHAQLTTTVKRIRLEHATAAELAGTTLDLGHAVFNEENLADLRIGDGATPGGIRVGSDWWTNNMLSAWGGLSRVEVEALVALSIPHVDLTPYAFSADLLDYARLSDYAAATNAIWGSLATEASRLDGRIDDISDWSRRAATNDIAWRTPIDENPFMRLRGEANYGGEGGLAFYDNEFGTFQTLGLGDCGEFWRLQVGDGVNSAFTGPSAPLWSRARIYAEYVERNFARTNKLFPMWMGGIWGDGIVSSNGTLAVESNLVVGTGIINDSAISNWNTAYGRIDGISAASLGALTAETDPAWTAASGSVVYATTPGYTAAVEQAASAYGWGDHAAAGYLTAEADAAALSAVAAVSGRVDTVEGWGDHAEAGYVVQAGTNDFGGITAVTGRVGTLTVTNALNVAGVIKSDIGSSGGVGVLQLGSSSWGKINTPGTELFVNYDYPTKNMMFGKSGNSMLFRVFGKVGIGVALPVEALEVDGKIKATKINFSGCPTSTNGLVSGDVWNDGGALRIVP